MFVVFVCISSVNGFMRGGKRERRRRGREIFTHFAVNTAL